MKILKTGKINKEKKFTCKECHTVFMANEEEYSSEFDRETNKSIYFCKCPICDSYCYIYK